MVLLAIIATFTMINGMLVWPLLVAYAIYHRLGRTVLLPILVTAIICIGGYLVDFRFPAHHPGPSLALSLPLDLTLYLLRYLGNPFPGLSLPLGLAGLGSLAFAVVVALRYRPLRPAQTALIAVSLFVLGTAAMTAFGRVAVDGGSPISDRYVTPAAVFWVAQGAFWMSLGAANRTNRLGGAIFLLGAVGATAGMLLFHTIGFATPPDYALQRTVASDALVVGVRDAEVLRRLYPNEEKVLALRPFLKERSFSVFAEPVAARFDQPVAQNYTLAAADRCDGGIDASVPAGEAPAQGWRLAGDAWDRQEAEPPGRIVITDSRGLITGLASTGHRREPGGESDVNSARNGWIGYAKSDYPPFTAYGLLDDGATICALG